MSATTQTITAPAAAPPVAKREPRPLLAVAWMMGALVSFSIIAIAGREATKGISVFQLMFWRSLIGLVILIAIASAMGGLAQFRTQQIGLHIGRNIAHYIAQFSWMAALTLMPLAQLFSLEFMSPLWVAILAPAFLGEKLTGSRIVAAAFGFTGTLVVIFGDKVLGLVTGQSPSGDGADFLAELAKPGTLLGITCAIGFAITMIAAKKLTRTESAFTLLFWMMATQTVGGAVVLFGGVTNPDLATKGWILVLTICALTAHFCLAKAIGLADAIIVAPLDFLRLPLIALIGYALYSERLEPFVLIGGGIVVLANVFNIWSEHRRKAAALV